MKIAIALLLTLATAAAASAGGSFAPIDPSASGPGLQVEVLNNSPETGGFWSMGTMIFGNADYIDIEFDASVGSEGAVFNIFLTIANNSGVDMGPGIEFLLEGPVEFTDGVFPTSLLPFGDLPVIDEPDHLRFENISLPGDGATIILQANLLITDPSGGSDVTMRVQPIPEPGTGLLLLGALWLTRRRR